MPGTDDPSPVELAAYAVRLGERADQLARTDPLPGPGHVIRELRQVRAPEGMAPLADTRLVGLAAAVSQSALASPKLELYPRDLPLEEALRLTPAGAGVRPEQGITVDGLLRRVRSRFPELDAVRAQPSYVRIEEALREAGFPLAYDEDKKIFVPPQRTSAWPSSTSAATSLHLPAGGTAGGARTSEERIDARLSHAVQHGGFLALSLHEKHLPGIPELLADAYPVVPADVAALFLAEFRGLAAELGTPWEQVLQADATLVDTDRPPAGLASYVRRVLERVERRLLDLAAEPGTVLFLYDAAPLARYFTAGGHDLLARLQNAARRPGDVPHGLWLLCPSEAPRAEPNLDGRTVEAIRGDGEWAVLGSAFLNRLRGESAA